LAFPTKQEIVDAHKRITPFIHRTPVLTSKNINSLLGIELYFKCENLQKVGAFKIRGATNAVMQLSEEDVKKGIATHSSGNHAAALALAGKNRDTTAYVVMPENSPRVKVEAVNSYGAKITFCKPTLESRETTLDAIVKEKGATFIHPYNNKHVITGQATACKELIEDSPVLDYIIAPIGGGGLLSGTLLSANYFASKTMVIGAEPAGADDAYRSIQTGKRLPSVLPNTICDGLLSALGTLTFPIIRDFVSEIITVSEDSIIEAMRLIYERMKLVVEPSAAVTLAVIAENRDLFKGKSVGLILSGGNVDLPRLPF